ncbi:translation initiation factor IF-2 [Streptomyces roseirectus]|uniref:Translation initiation factor IF-2 n=1 Tax=Streptomyces roseirectus TaxID=2768066 RepID=A0A7H0IA74_9ACTN|nr:translation initiation factor IF-2 [Streptomyces roseirectus]QNP69690.1 translation initiation factor IF-2 [Streptomyces roseirectus]
MRDAQSSGGTFFDGMSHEQMLAWLDQANAGVVSGAADRLKKAATEIQSIADELKVRPQWVAWKGEGADAFRTWAADLANATLRLSDFSRDSGTWLGHASDAISLAQSSIPRDLPGATANLAAANAAHNDPDAASIASKSSAELAALKADREKVRLEAATQMNKLAQSYSWSATQLNSLERPKLPPPPEAFVPEVAGKVDVGSTDRPNLGGHSGAPFTTGTGHVAGSDSGAGGSAGFSPAGHVLNAPAVQPRVPGETLPPVRTSIDSVGSLPAQTPPETPRAPVDPGPVRGVLPQTGPVPPLSGGGRVLPVNSPAPQGRMPGVGRVPLSPVGQEPGMAFGRAPSVSGGGSGIVGGRPVLPSESRPAGAIPRGTVVGGEGAPARGPMGPMGQTSGTTTPVGRAAGTPATSPGGRLVSPSGSGGIVGGRPTASPSGVVGSGVAQRPGRPDARVPGAGGTGPRTPVTGGTTAAARPGEGRTGAATSGPSQSAPPRNTRNGSGRPYGVTEDEETWRRNQRPTVPPVVD